MREAGTLLRAPAVRLLGNTGHQLEKVPSVALGKGEKPPITEPFRRVIHAVSLLIRARSVNTLLRTFDFHG
jgi:hypothetical protein